MHGPMSQPRIMAGVLFLPTFFSNSAGVAEEENKDESTGTFLAGFIGKLGALALVRAL